jgi:hypothetical protein
VKGKVLSTVGMQQNMKLKDSKHLGVQRVLKWEKIQYLGLPLTLGINRVNLWEGVLTKIKEKIDAWGGHWLTHGGKLTLIKAVSPHCRSIKRPISWHPNR